MIQALGIERPRLVGIAVAIAAHGAVLAAGLWTANAPPPSPPQAAIRVALAAVTAEPVPESAPEPVAEPMPTPPEPTTAPEPLPPEPLPAEPTPPEPALRPDPIPEPVAAPPQAEPIPEPVTEPVLSSSAAPAEGERTVAPPPALPEGAAPATNAPPPALNAKAQARQASYFGQVLAWLDRHKRYPRDARRARIEGVAELFISIDRGGRVRDFRLVTGSGHPTLDDASLAMVRRADPLPAMPRDLPGDGLEFVVPVEFFLKGSRR